MYFINPHIPAYYFNRKKQTEPVDGKFTYCYPNVNQIDKYEVSPEVYDTLKKEMKKNTKVIADNTATVQIFQRTITTTRI